MISDSGFTVAVGSCLSADATVRTLLVCWAHQIDETYLRALFANIYGAERITATSHMVNISKQYVKNRQKIGAVTAKRGVSMEKKSNDSAHGHLGRDSKARHTSQISKLFRVPGQRVHLQESDTV
jgi:hypothetical protein